MTTSPLLLPSPQHLELTGDWIELDRLKQELFLNLIQKTLHNNITSESIHYLINNLSNQISFDIKLTTHNSPNTHISAYRLNITAPSKPKEQTIIIESNSVAGTRNALITLSQLLGQYEHGLPGLIIDDAPAYPTRGIMLDISRDRVPRQEEILRLVDLLASWKINHLQLYTEHTFAYPGHETVWREASPFTPDEIRELDHHCQRQGITLAANQNCFGHLTRWLKHPSYAPLAEVTGEWSFNGIPRRGPFSLCPEDLRSIELIRDLLQQLRPCFSSGIVNIGCDETYDIGQGKSHETVKLEGYFKVYWRFVQKVIESARRLGFKSQIWADMILKQPESVLKVIPEDVTLLAWGYEPGEPSAEALEHLQKAGKTFWVCPGTSSWRSFVGRTYERRGNLNHAAQTGLECGAQGFLATDWGDLGHRQQWPVSLIGLAEAAEAAWRGNSHNINWEAVSRFAFNDPSERMALNCVPRLADWSRVPRLACKSGFNTALWLNELGDADLELRQSVGKTDPSGKPQPLRNASALFVSLHTSLSELSAKLGSKNDWKRVDERLSALEKSIPAVDNVQFTRELALACDTARFVAARALFAKTAPNNSTISVKLLTDWIGRIIQEHRSLWQLRSREGGLTDSCQYYIDTLQELEKLKD
ncbi:MAG: family 20 glycosylhydrolase [Calditrichota bacterium]